MEENNVIKIIHEKDMEIVEYFIDICEKNNLTYYIIGGTFLGAIRHKGFIPWDDDVDIAMPREDYEKFLKLSQQDEFEYQVFNYKFDEEYKYYITRLCNPEYEIEEVSGNITKLFIDIFPIDGMPSNKIVKKFHVLKILYHRMKLSFYYNKTIDLKSKRNLLEKILIIIAKKIPFYKIIDPTKEKKKIDRLLKRYSFYTSKYSGTIMGAYREREIVPTDMFGKPTLYNFENIKLYGPEKYDEYLTHMYGDYMKLPKVEDRRIHCKQIKRLGEYK